MTGRRVSLIAWALACAAGAAACKNGTGNSNHPPPPTGTGGIVTTGTAGTGGPIMPSGMVAVEILQPMGDLIAPAGSLVDVEAHAYITDQGNDFIDPTSVEAIVTKRGDLVELDSTKLASEGLDMYAGRISLGDLPTGDYSLTVHAVSSTNVKGASTPFDFQIDGGPTVLVRSPQPLHSYKGLLVIDVYADAGPFGPFKDSGGVPHATVANYEVPLSPVGDPADNNYRGMINLEDPDPANMAPPLIDEQLLTVWATNQNDKRTEVHLVFDIDETGPEITLTSPKPGEIVGNIMRIAATVNDPAGVLDSSVIAVIGDDTRPALFNIQLKPDGLGVYSTFFDTRKLTACPDPPSGSDLCIVFPTISFRASDELGNERVVGYDFAVDNVAPVADLDPPNLRSFKIDPILTCSWEFDPLGNDWFVGDMPNDRTMVPQVFDLRARVEDDSNHATGLKIGPISTVDPQRTSVYILDDETQPLIVDTDNDGWCDSINPLLVPTTEPPTANNQVLKVRLVPIPPSGSADFSPDPSLPAAPGPGAFSVCPRGGDALPKPICNPLQPTIAIGYASGQPAIWTVEPLDTAHCFGNQFDTLANNIGEGWACIAVGTYDKANNFSVSPPLRVNINYRFQGPFGAPGGAGAPACTGIYDRVMNKVTPGACKTRRFDRLPDKSDYLCYGTDCPGPALPPP